MPAALHVCFQASKVWRSGITAVRRYSYGQPRLDSDQTRQLRILPHWHFHPWRFDMKPESFLRPKIRATVGAATAVLLLATASAARADDAANILKSMTDYLSNQKTLSASFDSDIEVITPQLQKIQF